MGHGNAPRSAGKLRPPRTPASLDGGRLQASGVRTLLRTQTSHACERAKSLFHSSVSDCDETSRAGSRSEWVALALSGFALPHFVDWLPRSARPQGTARPTRTSHSSVSYFNLPT